MNLNLCLCNHFSPQKKHPTRLERYTQLTSAALKRKSSTEGSLAPPSKQTKLWETRRVSQASVDKVVLKIHCLDYIRNHLDCQAKNHISEGSQSSVEEDQPS
ncbi:hypothetical protein Q7C36_020700 [Tachysurus vachellii]|uniref:Uncharacterized protein n=1 Tax=Tachysurus vachellii TaxID=175792 RepID=A0AA88IXY2_TACVA|nr:hypothetical protein Q7C36_020700 [Tachysurus vachellii]